MIVEKPMSRILASETQMQDNPPRSIETGAWVISPNAPDAPAQIWWPLDGTYNIYGAANPKVT